jgi:hypothetical protein
MTSLTPIIHCLGPFIHGGQIPDSITRCKTGAVLREYELSCLNSLILDSIFSLDGPHRRRGRTYSEFARRIEDQRTKRLLLYLNIQDSPPSLYIVGDPKRDLPERLRSAAELHAPLVNGLSFYAVSSERWRRFFGHEIGTRYVMTPQITPPFWSAD